MGGDPCSGHERTGEPDQIRFKIGTTYPKTHRAEHLLAMFHH
jgi:hypothetical protein